MKTIKSITVIALLAAALLAVSCGGNSKKQRTENPSETTTTKAEARKKSDDGAKWPSNDFTKQVPKPDIAIHKAGDGPNGYNVDFVSNTTLEQVKAYSVKVKAAGFNVDVYEDDDTANGTYSFSAGNSAGWRVIVSRSQAGAFTIISKPE